jgi:hypothetical protein
MRIWSGPSEHVGLLPAVIADRLLTSMTEIETIRMPSTSGIVIRSLKMIADWTIPKIGTRKWNA